jgi:hypothetical protein
MSEENLEPLQKRGKGRPPGAKNKPKRGRPKGSSTKVKSAVPLKFDPKKQTIPARSEDEILNSLLSEDSLLDVGYNTNTDKIINQEPVDASFYYRGSRHVPVAGAQYEFTVDMINELRRCKGDIIYFAENFFYIVSTDDGKQKIKLYEAQKRMLLNMVNNRFSVNLASRQSGKALSLNTPIATTAGRKTIGELTTNDIIFGSDGSQINITHLHPIEYDRPCYRVSFDNGEVIVADEQHEWFTHSRQERRSNKTGSIKTTKRIFDTLKASGTNEPNHRIPISLTGIQTSEKNLPIDPYVLGLWLGDGAKEAGWITVGDRDIEYILQKLNNNKQFDDITTRRYEYTRATYVTISVKQNKQTKSLHSLIKKCGLYKNKHIPEEYFLSSRSQKLELLKGLIDSDGYVEKNGIVSFYSSNLNLANQFNRLVNELGYKTTVTQKQAKLNNVNKKISYSVNFKPREIVATLPFKVERLKLESSVEHAPQKRAQFHYIVNVEPCQSVPVRCITVNSKDSLFLAGNSLIPTHNSTLLTIFVLWMACFNDDHRAAIVANKESTAINIFKRVRMAYEQLPNYIKPGVKDYGKTGMTLGNDSSILVSTTTATSIRGDSLSTLAIDEVAFIECLYKDTTIRIKNKHTNEIKKITIEEACKLLKQTNKHK